MTTEMWMFVALGAFGGFFAGRIWAEVARARHDMDRVWHSRRNYRD